MPLRIFHRLSFLTAAFLALTTVSSSRADDVIGLTSIESNPLLIGMNSDFPLFPNSIHFVVGLDDEEKIVGMDLRPATGTIYGVARNTDTGALRLYQFSLGFLFATASPVGTAFNPPFALAPATAFGFDFNPTIDRARLVADNDTNVVFNPDTGAVTTAVNLFYATGLDPDVILTPDPNVGENPNVVNIAYDNNDLNPGTDSQLRGIDTELDILVTIANSVGRMRTVGSLGVNVTAVGGYDVSSTGNAESFAIMSVAGSSFQRFFEIDHATGQATVTAIPIFGLLQFTGITVLDAPTPPPQ